MQPTSLSVSHPALQSALLGPLVAPERGVAALCRDLALAHLEVGAHHQHQLARASALVQRSRALVVVSLAVALVAALLLFLAVFIL